MNGPTCFESRSHVRGAPAIAVEILSPGTRRADEQVKWGLFDRGGVREYWLVDPEQDRVRVYRRAADGRFPVVADLTAVNGDTLVTPQLSGFVVPLQELFR